MRLLAVGAVTSLLVAGIAAAALPRGVAPRGTVHCASAVSFKRPPSPAGRRVLLDRVALPPARPVLDTHRVEPRPLPWFAKNGLIVRRGTTAVDLLVPRGWKQRLAVVWGDGVLATRLRFEACPGAGEKWLAFPGGFRVRARACVPLIVRVAGRTARVRVPVGAPCR